jgi:hypothetical protein
MAIVDARVLRELKLSESLDKQTKKLSGEQTFIVISDTRNPLFSDILANTATFTNLGGAKLPQSGDSVTVNGSTLVVTSRRLAWHDGSDRVVEMIVSYNGFEPIENPPPVPNESEERTWRRFTVRTQQTTEPARGWATIAEAGNGLVDPTDALNTAGDPVEGLERDVALVAYTYTNPSVEDPDIRELNSFVNTCNDNFYLGCPPYTVRCTGWSGEFNEQTQTWSISVEFLYKENGWWIEYIDAGFNEIVGGRRKAIVDALGHPVSTPVPLDGLGTALAPNDIAPNALTIIKIYPYRAEPLNILVIDCRID